MSWNPLVHRMAVFGLVAAVVVSPSTGFAGSSDISLFSGGGNVAPNLLLMFDTSGSMDRTTNANGNCRVTDLGCSGDTKRTLAGQAFETLVRSVNQNADSTWSQNARFGLMSYRQHGAKLEVPFGGNNNQAIINVVTTTVEDADTPLGGAMLSAGRYYSGSKQWGTLPVWGTDTYYVKFDATLHTETVAADPIDLVCRENHLVFVSDGEPWNDIMDTSGYWATVGDADGDGGDECGSGCSEGISEDLIDSNSNGFADEVQDWDLQWGDDIAYAMANGDFSTLPGDQPITTHVVGFDIDSAILQRMATNGGGSYYTADNAAALAAKMKEVVDETIDSTATFSTAVVPTSRTIGGSAFYNAYFAPGKDAFWEGHLEAYGLSRSGDVIESDGVTAAIDNNGFIKEPHDYHWDAGEELRTNGARTIYTTIGGSKEYFNVGNTNLTSTLLDLTYAEVGAFPNSGGGAADLAELRANVINYLHGEDAFLEEGSTASDLRSEVLGDIFHSTPRIVSAPTKLYFGEGGYGCNLDPGDSATCFYKSYRDRDRYIYVGANDGMLHAFDAGVLATGDDPATPETEASDYEYYTVGDGSEEFAYVPGLLLDKVKMVSRNYPRTYYYVDGGVVHAEAWLGDGLGSSANVKEEEEWASVMIAGFREGGAGYIAFDVTDPDAGDGDDHGPYPLLLWEFTDSELGQTWSDPVITRVKMAAASGTGDLCGANDGDGDCVERWVAIFAGGYDPKGDPNVAGFTSNSADANWTDLGKAIYVVALDDGSILARIDHSTHAAMDYSLPSAPAVADLDTDGFADVIYVGDLGGQLWKWNIDAVGVDGADADTFVDNWTARVLFQSGITDMGSGVYHYRSIFFPPALSWDRRLLTLSFGTGEREDLTYVGDSTKDENNRFYSIKDRYPTGANAGKYYDLSTSTIVNLPFGESKLTDVTSIKIDNNLADLGAFFIAQESEKFTSDVTIFAGYVLTTSYQPTSSDPCQPTGESFLYSFRLRNSQGFYDASGATVLESRRKFVGQGLASAPRVSMGQDAGDDRVFVKTSKSQILPDPAPPRGNGAASIIYWKQIH